MVDAIKLIPMTQINNVMLMLRVFHGIFFLPRLMKDEINNILMRFHIKMFWKRFSCFEQKLLF